MHFVKSYLKAFGFMFLCCVLAWIVNCVASLTAADFNSFAFWYGVWVCTLGGLAGPIVLIMERKSS